MTVAQRRRTSVRLLSQVFTVMVGTAMVLAVTSAARASGMSSRSSVEKLEKEILEDLYLLTRGGEWFDQHGWATPNEVHFCEWFGVLCFNYSGIMFVGQL